MRLRDARTIWWCEAHGAAGGSTECEWAEVFKGSGCDMIHVALVPVPDPLAEARERLAWTGIEGQS